MNYKGTIIEESLNNTDALKDIYIISTKVEKVVDKHKTPWLERWTLHKVEVPEDRAEEIAEKISETLDYTHGTSWYADFKNGECHYIIFKNKIFKIDRTNADQYAGFDYKSINFGVSYDVNFSRLKPASNVRGGLEFSINYIFSRNKYVLKKESPCPIF